jgi:hypothetical protein
MARSWLKVSEFDKLRDNRRRRNSPLEADNAAHTTPPIPGSCVSTAKEATLAAGTAEPTPGLSPRSAYFERALAVARAQQAKSWELRAATSIARL